MQFAGQAGQDLFPRAVIRSSERTYTYIDIGAGHPVRFNNTCVLENEGWYGLCIDIVDSKHEFDALRKNPFLCADVTSINWFEVFKKYPLVNNGFIDFMSFDVDDATIPAFDHFPFEFVKARTITIEHDVYRVGPQTRDYLRNRLTALGYMLVCEDVSLHGHGEFEDWWVYPCDQVHMEYVSKLKWKSMPSDILSYMMGQVIAEKNSKQS